MSKVGFSLYEKSTLYTVVGDNPEI